MAQVVDADVLVVGGGGAALRAAIEAHRAGARVALATKGQLGVIGLRGGGATASGTAADRRQFWPVSETGGVLEGAREDVIQLGLGMAAPKLSQIMVEEAPSSWKTLQRLGVRCGPGFWAPPGHFTCNLYGLVPILASTLRRTDCIIFEKTMVVSLLKFDGSCVGAIAMDEETGELRAFRAGAVILGTGGAVQLYKHNLHPSCVTGDGYAVAYRAGAELLNLEFPQVFLGTVYPTTNNLANWVWGEKVRVYNARNEEFLEKYLPRGASLAEAREQAQKHGPFSTRDSLSRYLYTSLLKEVMAGRGTIHDGVYMDLTAAGIRAPIERDLWLRYRGIEWDREAFEVDVFAMCSNGGLRVDHHAQSTIPGLFAAGECVGGINGADRHGGSMMGASQVFAARAGVYAARLGTKSKRAPIPREAIEVEEQKISEIRAGRGRSEPREIRKNLQLLAWNHLLVVRNRAGLENFLGGIEGLRKDKFPDMKIGDAKGVIEAIELQNLLLVGEMIAKAALTRTESRGGHYREDCPERDDAKWMKSIVIKSSNGEMKLDTLSLHPNWRNRPEDMRGELWG